MSETLADPPSRSLRALFIVGTRRGYITLRTAIEAGVEVCGVICFRQHAHERDRYEQRIAELARAVNVPCYETSLLRERNYADLIGSELRPDIAYLVGVRVVVPAALYDTIPFGALAAHDSLLPRYRGFAPLNWCILNGESETGVSLFRVQDDIDDGPIVAQCRVPIGQVDSADVVYERTCQATADLVMAAHQKACRGNLEFVAQDPRQATYTCSRMPNDGLIDWSQPTHLVFNQIRGLAAPFPGAFTLFKKRKLTVWKAAPVVTPRTFVGRIPGRVVAIDRKLGSVDVLTGDGILRLIEVEYEDSRPTSAADIIRSVRDSLGIDIAEIITRLELLERTLQSFQVEPQNTTKG